MEPANILPQHTISLAKNIYLHNWESNGIVRNWWKFWQKRRTAHAHHILLVDCVWRNDLVFIYFGNIWVENAYAFLVTFQRHVVRGPLYFTMCLPSPAASVHWIRQPNLYFVVLLRMSSSAVLNSGIVVWAWGLQYMDRRCGWRIFVISFTRRIFFLFCFVAAVTVKPYHGLCSWWIPSNNTNCDEICNKLDNPMILIACTVYASHTSSLVSVRKHSN